MDRFKERLADQLRFIERSCQGFDAGDEAEAQRIATSVRVICHQTVSSTSLLTHLGATGISMLSTANSPIGAGAPCNLASLVFTHTDEGDTFKSVPPLDRIQTKRIIPFTDWWIEVVCLTTGVQMTRRALVLAVANQDGGAHVDATLKPDYTTIKSGAGLVMTSLPEGGNPVDMPLESHGAATLRQIGYEVLNSTDLLALRS
jgi:hypothetical protein